MSGLTLPAGFVYGAASAGHHVEGGLRDDFTKWLSEHAKRLAREAPTKDLGQGPAYKLPPSALKADNYLPSDWVDFYHRFPEDIALAKRLHLNALRISVEWSRIEPGMYGPPDLEALKHYRGIVQFANSLGIEVIVTLNHFTLPLWAAEIGGWRNPAVVDRFGKFAALVAQFLEEVTHFIPVNEIETYAMMVAAPPPFIPSADSWLDYSTGVRAYLHLRRNLVRAHLLAAEAIRGVRAETQIGCALNLTFYDGPDDPLSRGLRAIGKYFTNNYVVDRVADSCDWLGLQYYFHCRIKGFKVFANDSWRRSDMGWDLYPEGLRPLLHDLNRFGKPIYVTEYGLSDVHDTYRGDYIEEGLGEVAKAISEGVDCRGFLYFSLTDGSEWDKGRWAGRTGLIEITDQSERIIRPSAERYARLIVDSKTPG